MSNRFQCQLQILFSTTVPGYCTTFDAVEASLSVRIRMEGDIAEVRYVLQGIHRASADDERESARARTSTNVLNMLCCTASYCILNIQAIKVLRRNDVIFPMMTNGPSSMLVYRITVGRMAEFPVRHDDSPPTKCWALPGHTRAVRMGVKSNAAQRRIILAVTV
jgi:hypothetical protein